MAKQVAYSIGPVTGIGRTKTEARANAESAAADWLQRLEDDGPVIVSCGGITRLVVPTQYGTRVYAIDHEVGEKRCISYSCERDLAREVRLQALDIAKQLWDGEDDPPQTLAWRLLAQEHDEWRSWVAWQRRFRRASDLGFDHYDAHAIAGDCIGRPDLAERYAAAMADAS